MSGDVQGSDATETDSPDPQKAEPVFLVPNLKLVVPLAPQVFPAYPIECLSSTLATAWATNHPEWKGSRTTCLEQQLKDRARMLPKWDDHRSSDWCRVAPRVWAVGEDRSAELLETPLTVVTDLCPPSRLLSVYLFRVCRSNSS